MWWRIGIAAASAVVIAAIVVGKGMWLVISLPAIAATGTNIWSARSSVHHQCADLTPPQPEPVNTSKGTQKS